MFTSATGYIFSFGLSRRRHEPPFKPGGSVGALVGRPGFRAGFARIRARGRGRGSVGAACSSRKKPLDLQSSYHLIYSLARRRDHSSGPLLSAAVTSSLSPGGSDRHDSAVGPHTRIPTRSRRVGHCACGRQPPLLIKPQVLEVRSAPLSALRVKDGRELPLPS